MGLLNASLTGDRPPCDPQNHTDSCTPSQALAEREAKIKQEVAEIKKTYYCEVSGGGLRWRGLSPALAATSTFRMLVARSFIFCHGHEWCLTALRCCICLPL